MRKLRMMPLACLVALLLARAAAAKVDLVTLPERKSVQLTIYNSADLTLVRDGRPLTLKKGENRLQFSWANTLIDPTSLHMVAKKLADRIDIFDITYPPRVRNVGLWHIRSGVSGKVPVEITYFTSGLSWQAFYIGTLTPDEKAMALKGYVRVTNSSGEDYEKAQTRLIVGKINLLDRIAELARRAHPYGQPGRPGTRRGWGYKDAVHKIEEAKAGGELMNMTGRPKRIIKEGISEYFLYTIEGTETIKNGWSKRLPSFSADSVKVENLFKYEKERYGDRVIRFLKFKNDEDHNLGETPLPGGLIKVFRTTSEQENLAYIGADNTKYIPVDQKVELNLGAARKVKVEPKVMDYRKEHILFDRNRNIDGFDEVKDYRIEVKNHGDLPVTIEITRNVPSNYWDLETAANPGKYEKVDANTVKYTLRLKPHSETEIRYTLTIYHGRRQHQR